MNGELVAQFWRACRAAVAVSVLVVAACGADSDNSGADPVGAGEAAESAATEPSLENGAGGVDAESEPPQATLHVGPEQVAVTTIDVMAGDTLLLDVDPVGNIDTVVGLGMDSKTYARFLAAAGPDDGTIGGNVESANEEFQKLFEDAFPDAVDLVPTDDNANVISADQAIDYGGTRGLLIGIVDSGWEGESEGVVYQAEVTGKVLLAVGGLAVGDVVLRTDRLAAPDDLPDPPSEDQLYEIGEDQALEVEAFVANYPNFGEEKVNPRCSDPGFQEDIDYSSVCGE